jgi:hypothetical protein
VKLIFLKKAKFGSWHDFKKLGEGMEKDESVSECSLSPVHTCGVLGGGASGVCERV